MYVICIGVYVHAQKPTQKEHHEDTHDGAHTHPRLHTQNTNQRMHKDTSKNNGPEASFENVRFFFFILQQNYMGNRKDSSRGAGYLHIYSLWVISIPAECRT